MKRFYKVVSSEKGPDGYTVHLDGQPINTKSGKPLIVPSMEIANRVVQEWAEQKDVIDPDTMPFTQILNTKIDRVSSQRSAMSKAILKYLDTDLLCYCAAGPDELVHRQDKKWSKWRTWMEEEYACAIKTTTGLAALSQSTRLHENVNSKIETLDNDDFTILQIVVTLSGSLILGLAMLGGVANAKDVFEACFVEEQFKDTLYDIEKYGVDPHIEAEQSAVTIDLQACEVYLRHKD